VCQFPEPAGQTVALCPSTHSLLAVCPVPWLLSPVAKDDPTPRWKVTGVIRSEPTNNFVLPVRDMHVLYGLKREHYAEFARHHLPHAHEFFAPMDALTATDGAQNPELQTMLARASATANFMSVPLPSARTEQDRVDQ